MMPHILLEHSSDINSQQLIDTALSSAIESSLFLTSDIQVRSQSYSSSIPDRFVHVQARIWTGRTLAQKAHLSTLIGEAFVNVCDNTVSITVEVIDIEKSSYFKR